MDIKVILTIHREEIEEYKKEYAEYNFNEILTDKEVLENFEESFYGDCREYIIDCADVEMKIKEKTK